jgi:hypothetical protein
MSITLKSTEGLKQLSCTYLHEYEYIHILCLNILMKVTVIPRRAEDRQNMTTLRSHYTKCPRSQMYHCVIVFSKADSCKLFQKKDTFFGMLNHVLVIEFI